MGRKMSHVAAIGFVSANICQPGADHFMGAKP